MKRPLATVGFTAFGSLAVVFLLGEAWGFAASAILLVLAYLLRLAGKSLVTVFAAAVVILLSTGFAQLYEQIYLIPSKGYEGEHLVVGEVCSVQPGNKGRQELEIRIEQIDGAERSDFYVLVQNISGTEVEPYEKVTAQVKLYEIPGLENSYGRYCFANGYRYSGYISQINRIQPTDRIFLPAVCCLSNELSENVQRYLTGTVEDMACAMMLGERYQIRAETDELFTKTGLSHVLAVSGLHVTIVGTILFMLLNVLHLRKRISAVTAMMFVWLFAVMVGLRPSVVRATVLFTLCRVGDLIGEKSDTLNALGGGCILLLICSPQAALDTGFQLSVLSVAGLATVTAALHRRIEQRKFCAPVRFVAESLCLTAGAYSYTLPVLAIGYGGMYPVAFLSNLVLLPIVSVFLACCFGIGLCGFLPVDFAAKLFAVGAELTGSVLEAGMRFFAAYFSCWLPLLAAPCAVFSCFIFLLWVLRKHSRAAVKVITVGVVVFGIIGFISWKIYRDGAAYLAVGEEDAVFCAVGGQEAAAVSRQFTQSEAQVCLEVLRTHHIRQVTLYLTGDGRSVDEEGLRLLNDFAESLTVVCENGDWLTAVESGSEPFTGQRELPADGWSVSGTEKGIFVSQSGSGGIIFDKQGGNLIVRDDIIYNNKSYLFLNVSENLTAEAILYLRPESYFLIEGHGDSLILLGEQNE